MNAGRLTIHWKVKAFAQNLISRLPPSISYSTYYWLQRRFGGWRQVNPWTRLSPGIETWKRILRQGRDPLGATFLEVGTGRVPLVPLAYWLMGAKRTVTYDLNPYLRGELIEESLQHLSSDIGKVRDLFGPLLIDSRFGELLALCSDGAPSAQRVLDLCGIDYVAGGDAGRTGLPRNSVDFHTSFTVLEHVSPEALRQIFEEGNRIVRDEGLFVHRIDYSDHFSHSDPRISAINFLQYTDRQWNAFAGNRYMYMNRLRHDDFMHLLSSVDHHVLDAAVDVDASLQGLLEKGEFNLSKEFRERPRDVLSITGAWIVSEKSNRARRLRHD